MISSSSGD